jgi:hypothetical protein
MTAAHLRNRFRRAPGAVSFGRRRASTRRSPPGRAAGLAMVCVSAALMCASATEYGEVAWGAQTSGAAPAGEVPVGRRIVKLPAAAEQVVPAAAGKFLVAYMPALRRAAVVDVAGAKITGTIPIDDDNVRIAAGSRSIIAMLTTKRLLCRWNVETLAREKIVPYQLPLGLVTMGCASEGPLLVGAEDRMFEKILTFGTPQDFTCRWFDGLELTPLEVKQNRSHDMTADAYASADGRLFGVAATQSRWPYGIHSLQPSGNRPMRITSTEPVPGIGAGYVMPVSDGSALVAPGGLFDVELRPQASTVLPHVPAFDPNRPYVSASPVGNYYLKWTPPITQGDPADHRATLHLAGDDRTLATIDGLVLPTRTRAVSAKERPAPLWRRFFFLPSAGSLVTFGEDSDELIVQAFDLDGTLRKSGIDFLYVASAPPLVVRTGVAWSYHPDVRSSAGGVRYSLEGAPSGMDVSPAGVLTWPTPSDDPDATPQVVLRVTDGANRSATQALSLRILPAPAAPLAERPAVAPVADGVPPDPEYIVRLSGRAAQVIAAASGNYLLAAVPESRRIVVIDVRSRKIVREIAVDDDRFSYAAGARHVVVLSRTKATLTRYSLETGERELTTGFNGSPNSWLFMGCGSEGPLVVSDGDHASSERPAIFGLQTLRPTNVSWEGNQRLEFPLTVSTDGRVITSRNNLRCATIADGKVTVNDEIPYSYLDSSDRQTAYCLSNADGSRIFWRDSVWSQRGRRLRKEESLEGGRMISVPAPDGRLVLGLVVVDRPPERGYSPLVFAEGDPKPIAPIADLKLPREFSTAKDDDVTSRLFFLPTQKAIALVGDTFAEIVIRRFDLDEFVERSRSDYLFAISRTAEAAAGEEFVFRPEVRAKRGGLKFAVKEGPPQMTVADDGTVRWNVPVEEAGVTWRVKLGIENDAGRAAEHTFVLRVLKRNSTPQTAGPATPVPSPTAQASPAQPPALASTASRPTPAATAPAREVRTWTSKDGLFKVQASFVKIDADGKVRLRRPEGGEMGVASEQLSETDRAYLEQLKAGRP